MSAQADFAAADDHRHGRPAPPDIQLAEQARRLYAEELVKGLPALVQRRRCDGARSAARQARRARRRSSAGATWSQALKPAPQAWHRGMVNGLRHALLHGGVGRRGRPTCRRRRRRRR
ncbi:MAG: hypothetical protein MZW92_21555 [Comamonadaceae bacterium]|nr:hypothetical protein [Comamonadaceae bacterium]